jgi:hypothetical protein
MTPEKLSEFYCRPYCDEHEQVDELICEAFNLAEEGEALIAAEKLIKAQEIITETLSRDSLCNRTKSN